MYSTKTWHCTHHSHVPISSLFPPYNPTYANAIVGIPICLDRDSVSLISVFIPLNYSEGSSLFGLGGTLLPETLLILYIWPVQRALQFVFTRINGFWINFRGSFFFIVTLRLRTISLNKLPIFLFTCIYMLIPMEGFNMCCFQNKIVNAN